MTVAVFVFLLVTNNVWYQAGYYKFLEKYANLFRVLDTVNLFECRKSRHIF